MIKESDHKSAMSQLECVTGSLRLVGRFLKARAISGKFVSACLQMRVNPLYPMNRLSYRWH